MSKFSEVFAGGADPNVTIDGSLPVSRPIAINSPLNSTAVVTTAPGSDDRSPSHRPPPPPPPPPPPSLMVSTSISSHPIDVDLEGEGGSTISSVLPGRQSPTCLPSPHGDSSSAPSQMAPANITPVKTTSPQPFPEPPPLRLPTAPSGSIAGSGMQGIGLLERGMNGLTTSVRSFTDPATNKDRSSIDAFTEPDQPKPTSPLQSGSSSADRPSRNPFQPPSPESDDPHTLPTYDEFAAAEQSSAGAHHRFKRWGPWIEKRALERNEERKAERLAREERMKRGEYNPGDEMMGRAGWDLPGAAPQNLFPPGELKSGSYPTKGDRAETSNPTSRPPHFILETASESFEPESINQFGPRVTNADPSSDPADASVPSVPYPSLASTPGKIPLTHHTSIHPLGSRFFQQFPNQPMCAMPLPISTARFKGNAGDPQIPQIERFLLVGTKEGLWVVDLLPSLSPSHGNTAPNVGGVSTGDARCLQIWTGLGVHQLQVQMFQEDPAGSSSRRTSSGGSSNTGLVVGLVCPWTSKASDGGKGKAREKDRDDEGDKVLGDEGEKCIRMWSLQTLINLVKWRCYTPGAEAINLFLKPSPKASKRISTFSDLRKSLFSEPDNHKINVSAPLAARPASHHPPIPGTQSRGWHGSLPGKTKDDFLVVDHPGQFPPVNADGTTAGPGDMRAAPSYAASHYLRENSSSASLATNASFSSYSSSRPLLSRPAPGDTLSKSFVSAPEPDVSSSLPTQWANSFAPLKVARPNSSILFFNLVRPKTDPNLDGTYGNSEAALRRQSSWADRRVSSTPDQLIYLVVATKTMMYVYESRPGPNRTWQALNEYYVPFTPTFAQLVRVDQTIDHRRSASQSSRSGKSNRSPAVEDLCLFVGMKDKAVVVRLSDATVREVDTPSTPQNSLLAEVKRRAKSGSGSLGRASVPSDAASIMDVPGVKDFYSLGRASSSSSFSVESRDSFGGKEHWVGCDELNLRLPSSSRFLAKEFTLYLLTRGRFTHAVTSPLGSRPRSSFGHSDGMGPLKLRPLHAWGWRSPPQKVFALQPHTQHVDAETASCILVVLVAFTTSGLEVQEGTISLEYLDSLRGSPKPRSASSQGLQAATTSSAPHPFFTPVDSSHSPIRAHLKSSSDSAHAWDGGFVDEGAELEGHISYDFGTESGPLCGGGPWWEKPAMLLNRDGTVSSADSSASSVAPDTPLSLVPASERPPTGIFYYVKKAGDWKVFFAG